MSDHSTPLYTLQFAAAQHFVQHLLQHLVQHLLHQLLPFVQATLLSVDSMEETPENARLFGGQQISQDLLNKIAPSGMPPHKLTLKEGAPVMLRRNMHGARGHANGTRMLIRKIHSRVIEAEIVAGCSIGKVVFIPHIKTHSTDTALPFKFRRRQFPLRPAFAMTINKAQGQTSRMWPRLGSGRNVLCEWLSSVARSKTEKESMSRTLFTRSCFCGDACEETVMHVKSHDQVINALEPLPCSLFFSVQLHYIL